MSEANTAAVRVFEVTAEMADLVIQPRVPQFLQVHIPALNETRTYDLSQVSDAALVAALEHGLSQRLGDAAAGKSGDKAEEAVTKREKTLWAEGRTATRTDPVTAEMYILVCDILRRPKSEGGKGLKTKELPTMKEFPEFLTKQDEAAVAKIREVAEANVKAAAEAKKGLTL